MNDLIDTLVFSSGGINGIYYVGCLKALEEFNVVERIKMVVGTSAGALFGTLLSLNYTSKELHDALLQINTALLLNISIDNILSFTQNCGLDNGEKLSRVFEIFLEQKMKTNGAHVTFIDLFEFSGIHLIITGTCLETSKEHFFCHKRTPNMRVIDALRISTCIPLLFTPFFLEGKTFVDGGLLNHYPIGCPDICASSKVLGFNISLEEEYEETESLSVFNYINQLMNCMMINASKSTACSKNKNIHTVTINAKHAGIHFSLSKEIKKAACKSGYDATVSVLKKMRYNRMRLEEIISDCLKKKKVTMQYIKTIT